MASAAALALPSCCTSASSMATAFVSAPAVAAAAALSDRIRMSPSSLPVGLALLSPCSSGISRSSNRMDGGFPPPTQWLARDYGHGTGGVYRSRPRTALYGIQRDLFSPVQSKPQLAARSWSSSSSSSPSCDDLCLSNRLASAGDDFPRSSCRRRRRSTRLAGLRKPRDADGTPRGSENPDSRDENEGASRSSGGTKANVSSVPASKRGPPEDDDIWSKHSVFEFKSLNDPDTNACGYKGLSGQPRAPTSSSFSSQEPAPELRLTSSQQPRASFDGIDELLEAERPAAAGAAAADADFFKFRGKEELASVERRQEVERRRRGPGGGGGRRRGAVGGSDGGSAVKVELATQLGLPATSTYDELRTAYRVEIKRCHPDLAGNNEFRVKFLERKFLKLQGCWDEFSAEQAAGAATVRTAKAEAGGRDAGGSSQAARARARARAQEEARQQQAAAVAAAEAAHRSRRPVMDPGRKVMDPGNTSSC